MGLAIVAESGIGWPELAAIALARLAATGLSNAEIAERLVLSVRTVESHVYRAMQKLGVNDRRDLVSPRARA